MCAGVPGGVEDVAQSAEDAVKLYESAMWMCASLSPAERSISGDGFDLGKNMDEDAGRVGQDAPESVAVGRRPTMRDVAVRAGVSKALVSLVFRNAPGASPESHPRVLQAAAELGYRHNRTASLLARRRNHLRRIKSPHIDVVRSADDQGIGQVVDHMADLGHRADVRHSGRSARRRRRRRHHASGVRSHVEASKLNRISERRLRAYGSEGSYRMTGTDVQVQNELAPQTSPTV